MRTINLRFVIASFALLIGCAERDPNAAIAAAQRSILNDVSVVDVRIGAVEEHRTIIIEGERIAAIIPAGQFVATPRDAILASGGYAVPGLVEMHAHLLTHPWTKSGDLASQFDWRATAELLEDLAKYGVTTVRDPGAPTEAAVQLRNLARHGAIVAPEIRTAGRILTQSNFDPPPFAPVFSADDVAREIDWQAANGVDFIKVYASMTPELFAVAVAEAKKHGLAVVAHAQRTTWDEAARLGARGLSHAAPWSIDYIAEDRREGMAQGMMGRADWLDRIDLNSAKVKATISEMSSRGVFNDVTLIAMHTKFFGDDSRWTERPELAEAPPAFFVGWKSFSFTSNFTPAMYAQAQKSWPKLEAWARALHDGGVMMTVGTDTPTPWIIPGVSMHDEMALLVGAGFSPAEVLKMATLNGAVALNMGDRIGTLEAGKEADIVVLGADPTKDISATRDVNLVLLNGVQPAFSFR